jgi:hypothetical protein
LKEDRYCLAHGLDLRDVKGSPNGLDLVFPAGKTYPDYELIAWDENMLLEKFNTREAYLRKSNNFEPAFS